MRQPKPPDKPPRLFRTPAFEAEMRAIGFTPMDETLPQDVHLTGYPKSGNTWMQNLIVGLVYGIPLERVPLSLVDELVPGRRRRFYRRFATPMYFKSHQLPQPNMRRVIYVLRDGRDAMVSYYHYLHALHTDAPDWLELVQNPKIFPGLWHQHIEAWLTNPHGADMLMVKYEDLKRDTIHEAERLCAFLSLTRDHAEIRRVVDDTHFDRMRQREREFGSHIPGWSSEKAFVRQGQVGGYAKEMPAEALAAFLALAEPTLKKLGYSVEQ
jgi:hypothetical protein